MAAATEKGNKARYTLYLYPRIHWEARQQWSGGYRAMPHTGRDPGDKKSAKQEKPARPEAWRQEGAWSDSLGTRGDRKH